MRNITDLHFSIIWKSYPGMIAVLCLSLSVFAGCKATEVIPEPYLLSGNQHIRCMQVLRDGLRGDDFWASIYAAEALVRNEYGFEVIPLFNARLESENDPGKRAAYAAVLVRAGRREALAVLEDVLKSDDVEARILAAQGMFHTASVANPSTLEEAMAEGNDGRLRLYAAAALALALDARTLDFIRQGLGSDDSASRYTAADIIAVLGAADDDMQMLLEMRKYTSSELERFFVLRALAIFGREEARHELARQFSQSDPSIRALAAFSLAESWYVEQGDRLYNLLNDPEPVVRVRAAQALLILTNPTSPERYLRLR